MDARTEFNRIFGDVVMSDNDAAWYIFKAGWNAARHAGRYDHHDNCMCIECRGLSIKRASAWRKRQIMEIED